MWHNFGLGVIKKQRTDCNKKGDILSTKKQTIVQRIKKNFKSANHEKDEN